MYKCIKACTAVTKKTNNPRFHTDKIIVIIVNAIQMIQMRMANALQIQDFYYHSKFFERRMLKPQERLEQLSRLFHAANRQFGGGLGGLGGLLGGELLVKLFLLEVKFQSNFFFLKMNFQSIFFLLEVNFQSFFFSRR